MSRSLLEIAWTNVARLGFSNKGGHSRKFSGYSNGTDSSPGPAPVVPFSKYMRTSALKSSGTGTNYNNLPSTTKAHGKYLVRIMLWKVTRSHFHKIQRFSFKYTSTNILASPDCGVKTTTFWMVQQKRVSWKPRRSHSITLVMYSDGAYINIFCKSKNALPENQPLRINRSTSIIAPSYAMSCQFYDHYPSLGYWYTWSIIKEARIYLF